jgi:hypothetical protein
MSNIKDVRPLCEILKERKEKQPDLILKKWGSKIDNLIEANEAYYKVGKEKELLFKNDTVKILKDG